MTTVADLAGRTLEDSIPKDHPLAKWVQPVDGVLVLRPEDNGRPPLVSDLVRQYEELTGFSILASEETRALMKTMRVGIEGERTVQGPHVPSFVHAVLIENDFALYPLHESAPAVLGLISLRTQDRNSARSRATFVSVEDLEWLRHFPALMVTTTVTLDALDVRQLSNAMRTMITDANTEQMLPAGNTSTMVLTGFPDRLLARIEQLRFINAESQRLAPPQRAVELVRLQNANAAEVAGQLRFVFERRSGGEEEGAQASGAQVTCDSRTNSLILVGSVAELTQMKKLASQLDVLVK